MKGINMKNKKRFLPLLITGITIVSTLTSCVGITTTSSSTTYFPSNFDSSSSSSSSSTSSSEELPTYFDYSDFRFEITGLDECSIIAYQGNMIDIVIPDLVTYLDFSFNVTKIANNAFMNEDSLKSVRIATTIKYIGEQAFYNCYSLQSIDIPQSMEYIGEQAFYGSNSLIIYSELIGQPNEWHTNWNASSRPVIWDYLNRSGKSGNFSYAFKKDIFGASITGLSGYESDIVIPDNINVDGANVPVTSISSRAFANKFALQTVYMPDSIVYLGEGVFYESNLLDDITLSQNIKEIPDFTFSGCGSLETVEIPFSVETIGVEAFASCGNLKEIIIPDSVTSLGRSAFAECIDLKYLTISSSITAISDYCFASCESLEEVIIPNSVSIIGVSAFDGCRSLDYITIPSSVTIVKENAFNGCILVVFYYEGHSIPEGWDENWNSLDRYVVYGYLSDNTTSNSIVYTISKDESNKKYVTIIRFTSNAQTNLIIPEYIDSTLVTTIADSAFSGRSYLRSVYIPNCVTTIGKYAFLGCSSLTIYCQADSQQENWSSDFNPNDRPIIYGFDISGTDENDFEYEYKMDDNGEPYALITGYNGKLLHLDIPLTINGYPVTTIFNGAFAGHSELVYIFIPKCITTIGSGAFDGCTSLTIYCEVAEEQKGWSINWNQDNCPVVYNSGGIGATSDGLEYEIFISNGEKYAVIKSYSGNSTNLIIPKYLNVRNEDVIVTSINDSTFYNCVSLETIFIPSSISFIGDNVFLGCANLTIYCEVEYKPSGWSSIWNPDSRPVVYSSGGIGQTQDGLKFYIDIDDGNKILIITGYTGQSTDVVIPQTINFNNEDLAVSAIDDYAFENNSSLTSIVIPSSVTSIGSYAFRGCSNLTIYCEAISKPSGWSSNWNYSNRPVVWGCISSGVTENGLIYTLCQYSNGNKYITIAGYNGESTEVVIPEYISINGENIAVTTIAERAFYNNTSLTSIVIPSSVTSIGSYAFSNCSNLESVTFEDNSQLKTIGSYAFYYCTSLTSIVIPSSVTSIDDYAFYSCFSLESVTFGENSQLTSIGYRAFSGCSSLTSIYIPDSVTTIGRYAFENCSNLTIYCEAISKPSGWSGNWNESNRPVVWSCTYDEYLDAIEQDHQINLGYI